MTTSSKHTGWKRDLQNGRLYFYYDGTAVGYIDGSSFVLSSGILMSSALPKTTQTTKATSATLKTTDAGIILAGDGATLTLPAVADNEGIRYIIVCTATFSDGVVVDGNASETISGATTKTSTAQYDTLDIVCDGTAWYILNATGTWS